MRTLKFRAYDKRHKRFFYAELHPTHISWASPDYAHQSLLKHGEDIEGIGFLNIEGWEQFTGLLDKNGKEIFEGDILTDNVVVNWIEKIGSWGLNKKGWMHTHFFGEGVEANEIEVIGNIYEHPELLKP